MSLVDVALSGLVCSGVLLAFDGARRLAAGVGNPPVANPVLMAALLVALVLALAGLRVERFLALAAPLRWLLAPALVALALVIDGNRALLRMRAVPLLVAVVGGSGFGVAAAFGMARALRLDGALLQAVTIKTASTPFVIATMNAVGGPAALAAALAVLTGVIGALLLPPAFDRFGPTDTEARALGTGVAAHLVGTEALTRRDPRSGGLAALAMVLTGTLIALVLPALWGRLFGA
jgi:putative effector of murein hydrolase